MGTIRKSGALVVFESDMFDGGTEVCCWDWGGIRSPVLDEAAFDELHDHCQP
jgi:hypothetical protein